MVAIYSQQSIVSRLYSQGLGSTVLYRLWTMLQTKAQLYAADHDHRLKTANSRPYAIGKRV